jgi:hypothetical protein
VLCRKPQIKSAYRDATAIEKKKRRRVRRRKKKKVKKR